MTEEKHEQHDDVKPETFKAVRVWLSDGTRLLAIWTGKRWWSSKGEVTPEKWELETRKQKKTDKILKKLPKKERPPQDPPVKNN